MDNTNDTNDNKIVGEDFTEGNLRHVINEALGLQGFDPQEFPYLLDGEFASMLYAKMPSKAGDVDMDKADDVGTVWAEDVEKAAVAFQAAYDLFCKQIIAATNNANIKYQQIVIKGN